MDNRKIGNFIKTLRKEKNLTQKALADQLNITDRAISRWERGIGCPDISLLEELAKILDVTVLELLKGEKLDPQNTLNELDLLESMNLSKKNIMDKIKIIASYLTVLIVTTISLFIIMANIQSIYLEHKKYDFTDYLSEEKNSSITTTEPTLAQSINDLNTKIDLILSHQGNYNDEDYETIKTYMNTLKSTLATQNNEQYLTKKTFTFHDLLSFYLNHQNLLFTYPLDNKKLYPIITSYQPDLNQNLIRYYQLENSIHEINSYIFSYLEQPYYIKSNIPYKDYEPNPYVLLEDIYEQELIIVNDIIEAGDIK